MKNKTVPSPSLQVSSPEQWRGWLSNYCEKATEIWLVIRKKKSSLPGIYYEEALDEALCFGWVDGKMKSVNEDIYALRFSPRRKKSIWSRANRERAERLTAEGRMTEPGVAKIAEAQANGRWATENIKPGM